MSAASRPTSQACVDGYVRVSRVGKRGGARFISPDVQREAIQTWTARRGFRLLEVFEELDESGARRDRPLLEQAIHRIEVGVTSALVVWRVDRFGRSLSDGIHTIDRIRAAGGGFYSVQDGLDISTDAGRLVLRILLSVAEYQLDGIRAGWENAREHAVRNGIHTTEPVPVGYRKTRAGRLKPDPATAPMITEIYRRRAAGASLPSCARYLEAEHVRTAAGNPGWTASGVSRLLGFRVYLGEVSSGRFVRADAHQPLIDAPTWQVVQRGPILWNARQEEALLAGLVRCAGCRHRLQPVMRHRASRQSDGIYYLCRREHAAGRCIAPAFITGAKLEPFVIDGVLTILRNRRRQPLARLADAQAKSDSTRQALLRYRDNDRIASVLGEERYAEGLALRQDRIREANLALVALQTRAGIHALPPVDDFRRQLSQSSVINRRALIGQVIDMAFVSQGRGPAAQRVTLCPAGTAPRPLPRPGDRGHVNLPIHAQRGWLNPQD